MIYEHRLGVDGDDRGRRSLRVHARRRQLECGVRRHRARLQADAVPQRRTRCYLQRAAASSPCRLETPTVATGGRSTVFEAFGAYGQLLPASSFLQIQTGVELPAHHRRSCRAPYYLRTAIGKTFATEGGLGRRWSPMIGSDRRSRSRQRGDDELGPDPARSRFPLSKRMHVLGNVGLQIPGQQHRRSPEAVHVLRAVGLVRRQPARGLVA